MQLINNELVYDIEDTPVAFDFADWMYLVPLMKAVSTKISSVEQRGIYGNEPRRFALVTSEALTEQEVTDVLAVWTNAPLNSYKARKISELSAAAIEARRLLFSDMQQMNALGGVYDDLHAPEPLMTKEECIATINAFRTAFYNGKTAIEAAISVEAVDAAYAAVIWPIEIVTE